MKMVINNRIFDVYVRKYDRFSYIISVYEIVDDNTIRFIGKAITNDIPMAIEKMIG